MAVRCNISGLMLDRLQSNNWGTKCGNNNTSGIIDNYLEHLGCKTVDYTIESNDSECTGVITVFNCEFNILRISFVNETVGSIFKVGLGDFVGGTEPFSYEWSFEPDDFELVEDTDSTSEELTLQLRPGKTFESLVSQISVTITDANFCTNTKTCFITPQGMMCGSSYEACLNVSDLQIINKFVQCSGPFALSVVRKN